MLVSDSSLYWKIVNLVGVWLLVVTVLLRSCHWSHLSCIDVSEDSRQLAPAPGPDGQAGPELTLTLGAGVLTPEPGPGRGRREGGVRSDIRTHLLDISQMWCVLVL